MRCTASGSPLEREKDTVLDPRKMHSHFSVFKYFSTVHIVLFFMDGITQYEGWNVFPEEHGFSDCILQDTSIHYFSSSEKNEFGKGFVMKELEGKIALVTGASRGLGRGIAAVLAEKGATVIANYRTDKAHAESICREILENGGKAVPFQADVSERADVAKLFDFVRSEFGRLDILVNNAGTTKAQDIFETSEEDWDFILKTNLKSLFLMSKAAMEIMRAQKSGQIINMTSIVAYRGALFGHVHYAATKGGILSFTRTLARTGAPYNITVNALAPGIIETELLFQTHGAEGVEKLAKTVPLGLGKPRDVGLAAAFLAGEGGRYLTGICLDINGGMNFH